MKRFQAPMSGIVYAVLSVVGILLLVIAEPDSKTDEEVLSHYADSGNRAAEIIGFVLVSVGVVFFLWFLSTLRGRLQSFEPEPRTLSALGFGAGVAAAALSICSAALLAGVSFAVEYSSGFVVDPNAARYAVIVGYVLLVGSLLVNCVVVATTSALALRTPVLPSWLGWAGVAAVVLGIAESFVLPIFVIPLWVVIVSVVLMRRTSTTPAKVDVVDVSGLDEPVSAGERSR